MLSKCFPCNVRPELNANREKRVWKVIRLGVKRRALLATADAKEHSTFFLVALAKPSEILAPWERRVHFGDIQPAYGSSTAASAANSSSCIYNDPAPTCIVDCGRKRFNDINLNEFAVACSSFCCNQVFNVISQYLYIPP